MFESDFGGVGIGVGDVFVGAGPGGVVIGVGAGGDSDEGENTGEENSDAE